MKIAFLFPGQGSQFVGMGKDIYEKYKCVQEVYKNVKKITGVDIAKITFNGPKDKLDKTQYTQLAVVTMNLGILKVIEENNIYAEISAGLSLGEYTALIYSGCLSFEDGIKLVYKRGELMQNLLPNGKWKMAAIMGLDEQQVSKVCREVKSGFIVPANYNTEKQIVLSGEESAIMEAENIAKELGAKKISILNTAGPFHTEKLVDASNALREYLNSVDINSFKTRVVKNIDGKCYNKSDDVREILSKHIINPVRFSKTLENMMNEDVDTFIEIGPGKTLSGFVKRTKCNREISILNINDLQSLEKTLNTIKKL